MNRLTKQWGNNPAVPCNFDLDFLLSLDKNTAEGLQEFFDRLAAYEDTGLAPEEIERIMDAYGRGHTLRTESAERLEIAREIETDRLRELVQADQDGRLVVLPCKVGDTVYQVDYMTHSEALKSGVPQSKDPYQNRKYGRKRAEYLPLIVREKKMTKSLFREFGKTVFLTREEAEAALAGKGGAK